MDGFKPYITGDGSVGLYSDEFNDIYHSGYGALSEAYEKFVFPVEIKKDNINVLDVCFGLGYNSKAFLNYYGKNKKINFDCLDINKNLFFLSPFIKTNHKLKDYFRKDKNDSKYWELYAESGYYDNKNKVAILYDLIGNFYDEGKVVLSMVSTKGTFDETTKKVILYDDTYFIYKDGTEVKADRFVWQGKEEDILAQGNVMIRRVGEIKTFSDKAVLTNNMKTLKIIGRSKTELYSKGNFDGKIK